MGIFIFLIGLVMGSFINVVIYRVPRGISIVRPRSRCPSCDTPIRWYHNIPLLSFALLGGKCAYCGAKISWRYPAIELLTGLLFVLAFGDVWLRGGGLYKFLVALYLSTVFVIIFFIDLDFRIIPDFVTLPGIPLGLLASLLPGMNPGFFHSVVGAVVGGALFLVVAIAGERIFKKESMGGGDIKLATMLGAFLGWQGILLVLALASFLGAIIGGAAILMAEDKVKARTVPFGPFLVIAALIVFYRGNEIIDAYLKFVSN